MLKTLHNIRDLDFAQIQYIYSEAINRNAIKVGIVSGEQALYEDFSLFLSEEDAVCCMWETDGRCVSCVRCEKYSNGFLLTCLETAPQERRKGYALLLVSEVLAWLRKQSRMPVYVHIHNRNKASVALHEQLGFRIIADYAHLIDGTVSRSYYTMKFE